MGKFPVHDLPQLLQTHPGHHFILPKAVRAGWLGGSCLRGAVVFPVWADNKVCVSTLWEANGHRAKTGRRLPSLTDRFGPSF